MIQRETLVLASRSAARAALLEAAGLRFEARPADIDEAAVKRRCLAEGARVTVTALLLAELKARGVDGGGRVVIGADQILFGPKRRRWDKPRSMEEARSQLLTLRGRRHMLVTGVVGMRGTDVLWRHLAAPILLMREFSDAFLDAYLAEEGERVLQSVGAYRFEGPGMQLFRAVRGEHAAILGLPMLALLRFLRREGVLTG